MEAQWFTAVQLIELLVDHPQKQVTLCWWLTGHKSQSVGACTTRDLCSDRKGVGISLNIYLSIYKEENELIDLYY